MQPDSIIPNPTNPQAFNRFSYVGNNPIRYNDPTGHCRADDNPDDCFDTSKKYSPSDFLDLSGYTTWERKILKKLYDEGGDDGKHGVENIIANNIHIDIGEPLTIYAPNPNGDIYSGDWQSAFSVGAWYDAENNYVYLNPYLPGVQPGVLPSDYALSLVIHESIHILQGSQASTAYGELEAWQAGFRVLDALNGNRPLSPTQRDIVGLPLNHDRGNLFTALNLMLEDQEGQYLGAYPLYIQVLFNP